MLNAFYSYSQEKIIHELDLSYVKDFFMVRLKKIYLYWSLIY